MRTHTLLTKVASIAVCFGVLLSGPVMAGTKGVIKDVELTEAGTLRGQVYSQEGQAIPDALVQLRYQGKSVAAAKSDEQGRFAISGVRGGAHDVVVGAVHSPVRLWANGSAPKAATQTIVVAADETIIRAQGGYCESCPPGGSCGNCGPRGFGMLDVITLATVGAAVGALVVGLDNRDTIRDTNNRLIRLEQNLPASP
ncbi:MAG: carboxypeptidase-like regulatory domain-containing protein [Planctomycetaceae bacterium]